jgi:hydroxyethylthiazole kinase-like uncharacterized protein yjeF
MSLTSLKPLYRAQEIRAIEQLFCAQSEPPSLMERAGLAAAELARKLARNGTLLVLAGPGNNGGDALVAARQLKAWWHDVTVVFTGTPDKLPQAAAKAYQAWIEAGGQVLDDIPQLGNWGLVIDGLFGIGLARDLDSSHLDLIKRVNQMQVPVLALDIPSGLDSDTGQTCPTAIRASHTLTFIGLKPGLLTAYGPDYCGEIHVATLGSEALNLPEAKGHLLDLSVAKALQARPRNSHKGLLGSVGVLGGAESMVGAVLLAGRAALICGAGRVYLGLLDQNAPTVDPLQPELMLRPPEQVMKLENLSCLVVGPGLGQSEQAMQYLQRALQTELPLILDADALNLIAANPDLTSIVSARKGGTVMTPHPAEAARLLGATTHEVQQDRIGTAQVLAGRYNALLLLKGAGSICALPDDTWYINPTGNPGLSSAGMGDVLSGMIGALVAQSVSLRQSVLLGMYLHGAAADRLVAEGIGPIGLTASEVTEAARAQLNAWIYPN